jgi:hypothetical protein
MLPACDGVAERLGWVDEDSRLRRQTAELTDRLDERSVLDRLIHAVRAGESRVLVLHGEAGIGKTVLLDYLARQAAGCRVARAVGVQSEMELAFAGLHQLLARMLGHLEGVPVPQADALRTAFGLSAGPPPDRFLVGLAVLGLLSEAAGQQPAGSGVRRVAGCAGARSDRSRGTGCWSGGRPGSWESAPRQPGPQPTRI